MVRVKAKQMLKLDGEALNILNQAIAMYPWFVPALSEKSVLLATAGEWDQALDTVQRVLDQESNNIDALQVGLPACYRIGYFTLLELQLVSVLQH
jgi:tetratricopeptide (TPR) repeat protein